MPALPYIDPAAALAAGGAVIPPGPPLSRTEVAALVAGLRRAAAASVAPVAEVTHLGATSTSEMLVLDRTRWLEANVDMAIGLLEGVSGGPLPAPHNWAQRVAARANGAQLGLILAAVGTRILGQFLPFAREQRLVLVAPNIAKAEAELGVPRADFRLWVCLHEQTHRLQFARAPWLRTHLLESVGRLLEAAESGPEHRRRRERPHTLVEAVTTPEQQAVLDEVLAVMALLEGYADDMMDRVGPSVVPSVARIRSRFEARRNRGGWTRMVNRMLSVDLKLAQYRDGARFCRAVIGRVGVDGLNAVYEGPSYLPVPAEIADPQRWVARVHG